MGLVTGCGPRGRQRVASRSKGVQGDRTVATRSDASSSLIPRRVLRRVWRLIRPMRGDYRRKFRMTLRQWLLFNEKEIAFGKPRCRWMGVRCMKNPLDMWIYQEILFEVKPDIVVEIGSAEGGTTMFLAHCLDLLGKGMVVSVDCDRSAFAAKHPRVLALTGRSDDAAILSRIAALCEGKTCMVIQDADHSRAGVLADLDAYSKFVTPEAT